MIITITLTREQTGLTLAAQLVNPDASDFQSEITTGFAEVGNGFYILETAVPVAFTGGIKVYEAGEPGTLLAFTGIEQVPPSFQAFVYGTVQAGSTLNAIVTDLSQASGDAYNGRVLFFYDNTSQMFGIVGSVNGFNPATNTIFLADNLPLVPQAGDVFFLG